MLIRELRPGQTIAIGDVKITMIHKSGQVARLGIEADKIVPVVNVGESDKKKEPSAR